MYWLMHFGLPETRLEARATLKRGRIPLSLLTTLMAAVVFSCVAVFAQDVDEPDEPEAPAATGLAADKIPPAPVLTPSDALKSFKLPPGFRIELVASEPMVEEPVQIVFDPDGRLWVLEMRGFMPNADGTNEFEKVGRVSILEDTDGDGKMDRSTVFLKDLVMPRALALVRDGALVAEPPTLWFCRDTNGDGVADEKIEVAKDYAKQADPALGPKANPEHASNGLLWALDNWIYSANHNVRFRNLSGEWERSATRQRGQWGLSQDDFGRLVYNSNSDQLRVDLFPAEYVERNKNLSGAAGPSHQPLKDQSVWPGRVNPGVNRGYRKGQLRDDGTLATFTGACGPAVYRGDQFPAEFRGNVFVCEPTGNLVRRNVLTESDGWITARNPYDKAEFLTSTDERFRPVNLTTGPDGALYVVDMYHGIIQHRIYLTKYLRDQAESRGLEKPSGLGRIYRIVHESAKPATRPTLSKAPAAKLVETLAHPNGWWRDTAQRLLIERRGDSADTLLEEAALKAVAPLARLHALWTLQGLGRLNTGLLQRALEDAHPRVKAAAIRLCEPFLRAGAKGSFLPQLTAATKDAAPEVQLQSALSLSEAADAKADTALAELALAKSTNALFGDAILSGLSGRELEFLEGLRTTESLKTETPGATRFISALAGVVFKEGDRERIQKLLAGALEAPESQAWQREAILAGVAANASPAPARGREAPKIRQLRFVSEPPVWSKLTALEGERTKALVAAIEKLITWPGKAGETPEQEVKPLTAEQQKRFDDGKTLYIASCGACHQPHGKGQEGLSPPLLDSEWVLGSEQRLVRIVLQGVRGPITVKGQTYSLDMPGLWVFDDNQIAAILTYIRREWGHTANPVEPETVKKIRAATDDRNDSWSEAELLKVE